MAPGEWDDDPVSPARPGPPPAMAPHPRVHVVSCTHEVGGDTRLVEVAGFPGRLALTDATFAHDPSLEAAVIRRLDALGDPAHLKAGQDVSEAVMRLWLTGSHAAKMQALRIDKVDGLPVIHFTNGVAVKVTAAATRAAFGRHPPRIVAPMSPGDVDSLVRLTQQGDPSMPGIDLPPKTPKASDAKASRDLAMLNAQAQASASRHAHHAGIDLPPKPSPVVNQFLQGGGAHDDAVAQGLQAIKDAQDGVRAMEAKLVEKDKKVVTAEKKVSAAAAARGSRGVPTIAEDARLPALIATAQADSDHALAADKMFRPKLERLLALKPTDWMSWGEEGLKPLATAASRQGRVNNLITTANAPAWADETRMAYAKRPSLFDRFTGNAKPDYYRQMLENAKSLLREALDKASDTEGELRPALARIRLESFVLRIALSGVVDTVPLSIGQGRLRTLLSSQQTALNILTALEATTALLVQQATDVDELLTNLIPKWLLARSQA